MKTRMSTGVGNLQNAAGGGHRVGGHRHRGPALQTADSNLVLGSVIIPTHYGYYGDVNGITVNQMYARYLKWFIGKYGNEKQPLSFRDWIVWAKRSGVVPKYSATGVETQVVAAEEEKEKVAVEKATKGIAVAAVWAMAIIAIFGILSSLEEE